MFRVHVLKSIDTVQDLLVGVRDYEGHFARTIWILAVLAV